MLDESRAVCRTVYLCLSDMAQVRVQGVILFQALLGLLILDVAAEGRTCSQRDPRRSAEALLLCWASRAVVVGQFIDHVPHRLGIIGRPVAAAALAGRFIVSTGLQRATARLNGSIILRRIGC
jgi:hypothetical protein